MNFSKYSYLTIEHLRLLLGYDDIRSVKLWCEKNGVFILKQGKARLVNGAEFMLTFYKPFIEHLKAKHGNWKERFHDYIEGNFQQFIGSGAAESEKAVKAPIEVETGYPDKRESKALPLLYPKKDRIAGIYAYCQKCKTTVGAGKCQLTKKKIQSCDYPQFHTFRASIVIPGTGGIKRRKKILNTTDLTEALRRKKIFEQQVNENKVPSRITVLAEKAKRQDPSGRKIGFPKKLLNPSIELFMDYMEDKGVPEHKKKNLSEKHIGDFRRYFKYFKLCLQKHDIDPESFKLEELSDTIVGYLHSYLLNDLNYQNKTYNKVMGQMNQFISWLNDELAFGLKNAFEGVKRRKTGKDNTIISKKELDILLSVITPENSIGVSPTGYRRNFYRDWIATGIRIVLETGLRREEFMNLKFSDIQYDENGQPFCIRVEDFKVNRMKNQKDEEGKDIKTIPVTRNLRMILDQLGHDYLKETDTYLIAPNETATRAALGELLSKAFTHFWKLTGIKREVRLKHLRKTYLTALVNYFGDKATIISDHADIDTIKEYYTNNEAIMRANQGFEVF